MISDFHVHTSMSADSEADIDSVIQTAIRLGMPYLCITDHHDIDYNNEEFYLDPRKYYKTLSSYKEKYRDQINLLIGVEMGLQPHLKQEVETFISSIPLDFVIGSSHVINGMDPYYEEIWRDHTTEQVMSMYFENIYENLQIHNNFDVYGHIDYAIRYAKEKDQNYSYEKYKEILDKILRKIISAGKGIEINTAGLRKGLRSTNPCFEIIKRYHDLGGSIITVGSDAHNPEDIGADFGKAKELLLKAGFEHYNLFISRNAIAVPLS